MTREYRPDALAQLCLALLPEDHSLAEEVALAGRDAHSYHARFRERLEADRGIGPDQVASSDFPWVALLDGLRYRRRLAEIDCKAPAEQVLEEMDRLMPDRLSTAQRWDWVNLEHWDSLPTPDFLGAIAERFLPQGRMLAQLYEASDSITCTRHGTIA